MGKKKVRAYIELFLDPVFRVAGLKDPAMNNLVFAGQDFILQCEKSYGENIFRAIVEGYDEKYLPVLKRIKEEAAKFSSRHTDFVYPGNQGVAPG